MPRTNEFTTLPNAVTDETLIDMIDERLLLGVDDCGDYWSMQSYHSQIRVTGSRMLGSGTPLRDVVDHIHNVTLELTGGDWTVKASRALSEVRIFLRRLAPKTKQAMFDLAFERAEWTVDEWSIFTEQQKAA